MYAIRSYYGDGRHRRGEHGDVSFREPVTGLLTMREDHHYAGFWIRLVARVIDLILLLAAFNLFILGDRMGADAGLWAPTGLPYNFV